jgi:hypothetical protein
MAIHGCEGNGKIIDAFGNINGEISHGKTVRWVAGMMYLLVEWEEFLHVLLNQVL